MLQLDLSRLRTGTEHIDRRFTPEQLGVVDDAFSVAGPVHLVADVRKDGGKVRLTGRLTATLDVGCSRCLEPFVMPIDAPLDLLFLPASQNGGAEEREVADDDLGVSFYENDTLDLGEVMREQFYLALPMKPVCREDCRGLCPSCGANRNRETCSCQIEWVDPRMDALRALNVKKSETH
jgi:uncharacterized protein